MIGCFNRSLSSAFISVHKIFFDGVEDPVHGDVVHAAQVVASFLETGAADQFFPDDTVSLAVGAGPPRCCGTEQGHYGAGHGGGHVHGACIGGD